MKGVQGVGAYHLTNQPSVIGNNFVLNVVSVLFIKRSTRSLQQGFRTFASLKKDLVKSNPVVADKGNAIDMEAGNVKVVGVHVHGPVVIKVAVGNGVTVFIGC